jgi:hypothetical protein
VTAALRVTLLTSLCGAVACDGPCLPVEEVRVIGADDAQQALYLEVVQEMSAWMDLDGVCLRHVEITDGAYVDQQSSTGQYTNSSRTILLSSVFQQCTAARVVPRMGCSDGLRLIWR